MFLLQVFLDYQTIQNKKALKDEDQKIVLEGNGYDVKDVWWDQYPEFWNPRKFDEVKIDQSVREVMS